MQILLKANLLSPPQEPDLEVCRHKFFPAPGKLLNQLLVHCRSAGEKLSFLRDMRFTALERKQADAFLVAQAKSVALPGRFFARQQGERQLTATRSKWKTIVTYRSIHLKRSLPPTSFRMLDQWTNELLAPADLELAWPPEFCGARLERTSGHTHVQVQHILGPVAWDGTCYESWDDGPAAPSTPRRLGTLSFPAESLAGQWDLARTAEPFGCSGTGLLVVSQRFYHWYRQNKWDGLYFWPVWRETSSAACQHRALWQEVLTRLQEFPNAQVWC